MTVYNIKKHFGATGDGVADDAPSFVAASNALTGTSGHTLYIPKGIYPFNSNPSINGRNLTSAGAIMWVEGIKQLRIVGDGGRSGDTIIRLNNRCNQFGARGQRQNGNYWARTQDVAAGAMSAILLDNTKSSLYIPGDYTLLCGINIQDGYSVTPAGYGFPSNLQVFEYIRIDTVNPSTGVVTFKTPVRYNYLSEWPIINIGNAFEINAGGPAGMYALYPTWDLDVTWEGIRFENTAGPQIYAGCRRIVYRDCTFPSGSAPIPTQNAYWGTDRCIADVIMETDKLIEEMEMKDSFWRGIDFQSASVRRSTLDNCFVYLKLAGGGADYGVVKNSFIPAGQVFAGAYAYGVCGTSSYENVRGLTSLQAGGFSEAGPTGGTGFSSFADKVDGTIIIPNGTNEADITDNGAGKVRIKIAPEYSAAQWKVGKTCPLGSTYQYMTTTAVAPIGTNVLTFASVPGWITPGVTSVLGADSSGVYAGMPATGSIVTAVTATTVTLSLNMTGNYASGKPVAFYCAPLSQKAPPVIAVDLGNNTVDVDYPFPAGYVYGSSSGTASWVAARWAVPGHSVYWSGVMGLSKSFKVLALRQDANFTYVDTDEPGGMPFSLVPNTGNFNITTPGTQSGTWSGLTGSDLRLESLNDSNSQNKPFGSYSKLQLTAGPSAANRFINMPTAFGHLIKIVIDVVIPYTGSAANCYLHFSQFDNLSINADGVRVFWGGAVNVKLPGKRVITPADISSNPTALANDKITVPSWSNILWVNFGMNLFYSTSNGLGGGNNGSYVPVANEVPSKWPLINIEVFTDQGFGTVTVPPLNTIAAAAGAYALSGSAVILTKMVPRILVAGVSAYALAGTAATLRKGKVLTADVNAYALAGTATVLRKGKILTAATSAYALTGTAVTLLKGGLKTIVAGASSYALTGTAVALTKTGSTALGTGLVSFWELGEATGTRVDSHGTNNFSTITGSPSNSAGVIGNALAASGGTNYVGCPDNANVSLAGKDFTFAGWFKWIGGSIFIRKGNVSGQNEFILDLSFTTGNVFRATFQNSAGNAADFNILSGIVTADNWYFISVTYTLATKTGTIRLNNNARVTGTGASTIKDGTSPLEVGANGTCYIDQLGFWNRALTTAEEDALYNGGAGLAYTGLGLLNGSESDGTNEFGSDPVDMAGAAVTVTSVTRTANNAQAPDGAVTAERFLETTASGRHICFLSSSSAIANKTRTFSVYAKINGRRYLQLIMEDTVSAMFDLQTGVVTDTTNARGTASALSATIQIGNYGYYKCTLTFFDTAASNGFMNIAFSDVPDDSGTLQFGSPSYFGSTSAGAWLWRPKLVIT